MALSSKDKKAVEAAAKAGGLKDVKVSSSGSVSASNSKASSSTPAPAPAPAVKVSTPTVTKTSSGGTTTPIATMGTTASDPKANVKPVSTKLPASQANNNVAAGVSIWGPSTINTSGGSPFSTNSTSSAANKSTANGLMSSLIPKASASTGSSGSSYTGGSIVDYLSSVGKASDFNSRSQLASQYGISGYSGTADQNTQLLNKLRGGSGSSATTYSTPAAASPVADSSQQYTQAPTTASVLSPYVAQPTGTPPGAAAATNGAYTPPAGTGLYGQLIADQASRTKNNEYDKAAKDYQKAVENRNKLKQSMDEELANIDLDPGTLHFQQGRKQVLSQLYAQKLADADAAVTQAQQGMQYATSQFGAETTALGNAIGAAGTTLSGGSYMPFGGDSMGMQAGLDRQRMVDSYNYNTQQGLQFSGQAANLDQPMHALSLLGPQLSNYLAANGLNQNTSVMANSLVNSGLSQTNPAAYAVIKNAGTEAQVLISQIAGINSNLIPSDITQKANAMSIDNMSPQDIVLFINAANAIAQPRYTSLKSSASGALNSTFQPYSGSTYANPNQQIPATPTPQNLIGNSGGNVNGQLGNAAIGGALQFGNYIVPALSGAASWFFGGGLLRGAASVVGGLIKR